MDVFAKLKYYPRVRNEQINACAEVEQIGF
jgi:hypothetical protein